MAISTRDYELGVAGTRGCVLQDGVPGRCPVRFVQQSVAVVGGSSGKPKRVLGVLSAHAPAVLKPSQGHLVDHLCRAGRDSRGPLAILVLQKVEDDLGVHRMYPRPVESVLQGEGGDHSLPVGHGAPDGHCQRAGEVSGDSDTGRMPTGSSSRRVRGGVAPGLRDPVVPGGAELPRVVFGGVPSDIGPCRGVSLSTFIARMSSGQIAGCSMGWTSAPVIMLAQDRSEVTCSLSDAGPPRWCTTRCPVLSGSFSSVCTAMCGSCSTSIAGSGVVPQGSPRGLGRPAPTCTITRSARSCACSVARAHRSSVVANDTGVGRWGRGRRGSGHATSALGSWCSPSTSMSQRMYRRAVGGWYAAPCVGGDREAVGWGPAALALEDPENATEHKNQASTVTPVSGVLLSISIALGVHLTTFYTNPSRILAAWRD